jgi:serine/threonine protein kinase
MDQLIGQVLHDRYRIQSLLGRQMGRRTFLASDLQTGVSVVCKLLLFNPDFTWDDFKLFEREAEVLRALDHPAVPKYLDYFEAETELGKGFALVQTYIAARSLQDWVQSGRSFSERELETIAKALLDILNYLHHRRPPVIHRDLKPSNILLGNRSGNSPGQVYLIDFGSVQTAIHGGTRTIVGTYGYMPLEQFGGQATPGSDLYALGATLIYLATGQHPDQLPQQEMRIQFENQVELSPNLIHWLKWLTEPDLGQRLQSAKQALEALEKPRSRQTSLTKMSKPAGSKVQITNTPQMIEVLIPPRGFHPELIFLIGFAIFWHSIFLMLSFTVSSFFFFTPHFWVGLWMIWKILFDLFGSVSVQITQSEISSGWEMLGVKNFPSRTVQRQNITKLELTRFTPAQGHENQYVKGTPHINIWAGRQKFSLGEKAGLTTSEAEWLAHDVSLWLDLPIERD